MDKILQSQKLQYLFCNKGGLHEGEELNYICLQQDCENKGLICSICKAQDHENHHVITLKNFLNQLTRKVDQQSDAVKNVDELLDQLEEIQRKKLYTLKEYVINVSESIKLLEQNMVQSYKTVRQRIMNQSFMSENMPKILQDIINGEYQETDKLQGECLRLLESLQINNKEIEIDFKPELSLKKYQKCQSLLTNQIKNMQDSIQTLIQRSLNIIEESQSKDQQSQVYQPQLKFSQYKKSSFIIVKQNGEIAQQTNTSNQDKRIALLEPKLANKGKSEFALGINKYMNWIGIGISFGKLLHKKNYVFTYQQLGHGNYFVSSNGYIWSGQKKEENSKGKGFTFKEKDIVLVQLDLDKKTLQFCKYKDKSKRFVFKDIDIQDPDDVYASVNICNVNESVNVEEWKSEYSEYFEDELGQVAEENNSNNNSSGNKDLFSFKNNYQPPQQGGKPQQQQDKMGDVFEKFSINNKKSHAQLLNLKNKAMYPPKNNKYQNSLF